jgi:hypothetical protein
VSNANSERQDPAFTCIGDVQFSSHLGHLVVEEQDPFAINESCNDAKTNFTPDVPPMARLPNWNASKLEQSCVFNAVQAFVTDDEVVVDKELAIEQLTKELGGPQGFENVYGAADDVTLGDLVFRVPAGKLSVLMDASKSRLSLEKVKGVHNWSELKRGGCYIAETHVEVNGYRIPHAVAVDTTVQGKDENGQDIHALLFVSPNFSRVPSTFADMQEWSQGCATLTRGDMKNEGALRTLLETNFKLVGKVNNFYVMRKKAEKIKKRKRQRV